jgi:hypothetical protein
MTVFRLKGASRNFSGAGKKGSGGDGQPEGTVVLARKKESSGLSEDLTKTCGKWASFAITFLFRLLHIIVR